MLADNAAIYDPRWPCPLSFRKQHVCSARRNLAATGTRMATLWEKCSYSCHQYQCRTAEYTTVNTDTHTYARNALCTTATATIIATTR